MVEILIDIISTKINWMFLTDQKKNKETEEKAHNEEEEKTYTRNSAKIYKIKITSNKKILDNFGLRKSLARVHKYNTISCYRGMRYKLGHQ